MKSKMCEDKYSSRYGYRDQNSVYDVLSFAGRWERNYCYGAGDWANKLFCFMLVHHIDICGFIVTKKENPNDKSFIKKPLHTVAEISVVDMRNSGVIVAVHENHHADILKLLNGLLGYLKKDQIYLLSSLEVQKFAGGGILFSRMEKSFSI